MTQAPRHFPARPCRQCRVLFVPRNSLQVVCMNVACAVAEGKAREQRKRAKEARAAKRAGLAKLMTLSAHLKLAQHAFNRWVRLRDAGLPCISCGRYHQGQWHAGHYRTVKAAPELRFEPDNVHKQCAPCNDRLSGNIVEYRIGLVKKIGAERVAWLEGPHPPAKLSITGAMAITTRYRILAKELERAQQVAA